jgi:DNA-binding NarL/FixJ family response regulator
MEKLLIVEDIQALRQYVAGVVRETLDHRPQIIEAANGSEGLRAFDSEHPSMVIMDIAMPEISGLKAAQQIWKQNPSAKILFWNQFHREAYVRELGRIVPEQAVHGYTLKGESADKLKHAVLSVFQHNNPYIDPKVRGDKTRIKSRDNSLSDVEYETLVDVMLGLTDRAIAARRSISVRGVQNRLASLLNKLVQREHWALQKSAGMEIYNPRTRVIYEALRRGFISIEELTHFEQDLDDWMSTAINYRRNSA